MSYQRVATLADIPDGRGLCVRVDGIDVGLFRVDGEIYAMENTCPHAGDPLSEGDLEGAVVVCAAHGWDFDVRTGFRPENDDGFPIPCFPVRIEDGAIHVDITRPKNLRGRQG
jgi:nitrite reductase/ring-hydroxylating ferredoxin subunit